MNEFDAPGIAALAARLGLAPQALLALAGRIVATPGAAFDARRLDAELARLRIAGDSAQAAAELALLGYQAYALDDVDRALQIVWSEPRAEGT